MNVENAFDYVLLKERIEQKGYSISQLASTIPSSRTTLSEKLGNKKTFRQDDIKRICEILNIPKSKVGDYFFTPLVQKTVQNEAGSS